METILASIGLTALAYLLGAVPFSYLIARRQGVDLRHTGSGNLGAGNVWRTCGFRPFLATIALDITKGTIFPLVAIHLLQLPPVAVIVIGAAAMLGHSFSVYMEFKGGKAVATGAGVLLAIAPLAILAGSIAWCAGLFLTRITAVGSLLGAGVAMLTALGALVAGHLDPTYTAFICIAGAGVVVLHRENIRRLRAGTENRLQKLL